jgi:hypothetical protein
VSRFQSVPLKIGALKGLLSGAVLAGGLAIASPGHAAQYFLQSATMDTSRTAVISGPGLSENAYIGPLKFTAFEGTGATPATGATSGPFSFLGFCVDIFHNIGLGTLNLKYDDAYDLETNSKYLTTTAFAPGATLLSDQQILQVGRLVNHGTLVFNQLPNGTLKTNKLAGLQGAIWQVVNPGYSVTSNNAAVNAFISSYSAAGYNSQLTGHGLVHSGITFISETGKYGRSSAHQSFALAAIPEPSTWALMIGGFGLAGAMLRRRRLATA